MEILLQACEHRRSAGVFSLSRCAGSWGCRVGLAVLLAALLPLCLWSGDRLDPDRLAQMGSEIRRAIEDHKLPGGVLWVESKGTSYHEAFGLRAVAPEKESMTEDTLFDVASMTKVLATAPALVILLERGKLKLDDPVIAFLPEFKAEGKESITLRHLLTHTSGIGRALVHTPNWSNPKAALSSIGAEKPVYVPGVAHLYSDLNFIILGEVVQRVSGMKLDAFATKEIFEPLLLDDTGFFPARGKRSRIAPTERSGRVTLRGEVHDPKARAMGGAAGHAGVFTTASDMARFARMMLRGGELDGVRILRPESVQLMVQVQTPPSMKERRGLGWDIDSDFSRPRGDVFPIGSYGHTGFTGGSLWIDPFSETFYIFLSNRVHPDESGNIHGLQKTLGTLAARAVKGFNFSDLSKMGGQRPSDREKPPNP